MAIEAARTRILYRSLDAAFTASLRQRASVMSQLGSMVSPRSSNYDRVAAFVHLLDRAIPGMQRRVYDSLYRPQGLPFGATDLRLDLRLIGFGSGATVFLLTGGSRRVVLKIYRRTIGRSRENLLKLAGEYREKLERVALVYGDVVLPASYLIVHGPILRRPAVAAVQDFLESPLLDFFTLGTAKLASMAKADPEFRQQCIHFATRTLDALEREGTCADLIGERNVVVVERAEKKELRLIDYGFYDVAALRRNPTPALHRLESCFSSLRALVKALEA